MSNIGYLPLLFLLFWTVTALAHVDTSDSEESASLTDTELHTYYRTLAEKAVRQLNDPSESKNYWLLSGLTDVKRRVMDGEMGVKYRMTVSVVKTACSTDGMDESRISAGLCAVEEEAERKICVFDIRISDQPVGDSERAEHITKQSCSSGNTSVLHQTPRKSSIPKSIKPKDVSLWHKFTAYTRRHSKPYVEDKGEMLKRFRIYKRNSKIAAMWQELDEGSAVYGDTIFSDLSPSEFRRTYLPYRWQAPHHPIRTASLAELSEHSANDELPAAWDWREKGVVTAVKNQEMCGSCWAFSVTGNVEGQWAIKTGKLVSLSEQELIDCDKLDMGCNGGLPANAYKEIIRMGGLEPENAYPYDAHREQCHLVAKDIAVYINDSVKLPVNETYMTIWLFKNGPISIGLNAQFMQFYRHGVSHPWKILCEPWFLDHGVLIVGYGVEGKKPFWVIKNSWGADWGESGYYRLYRGKDVCGVSQMATSAIVK